LAYPALGIDPTLEHVPLLYWLRAESGAAVYSWWPIWLSGISAPVYGLFSGMMGNRALMILPMLAGLACGWMVYAGVLQARGKTPGDRAGRWMARMAGLVALLATPLLFYAFTFWEHTLQTALLLAAFLLLARAMEAGYAVGTGYAAGRTGLWRAGLGGICMGLALYFRLESGIFIAAAGAGLLLWRITDSSTHRPAWRSLMAQGLAVGLGLLLTVVPLLLFNLLAEGHWLGRRHLLTLGTVLARVAAPNGNWAQDLLPALLVGTLAHQGIALQPLLAWALVLAWGAVLAGPWLLQRNAHTVLFAGGFALVILSAFALFTLDTYASVHGLVLVAPILCLGTWALAAPSPSTRLWGWFAVTGLAGYLLFSWMAGWPGQGGLQWGPRYALPLFPLWIIAGAAGLAAWLERPMARTGTGRIVLALVVAFTVVSAGFQVRGLWTRATTLAQLTAWEEQLSALPTDTLLVTDLTYLALSVPDIYRSHTLLLGASPLRGEAIHGWQRQAASHGYTQVCGVTRLPIQLHLDCRPVERGP